MTNNILWVQPSGVLAATTILDGSDPTEHAGLLQQRGDIPGDWAIAGINIDWPDSGWAQEAHRWDDGKIVVDFAAAVEETKARLRAERAPLMAALDIQFQRNLETGSDNAEVVAEKNRLRDVTNIPAGLSLDELKRLSAQLAI